MQLTNGAIKVGVQPPPMNPTAVEDYEGVDLNTFDLSAFAKPAKVRTASAAGTDVLSNNPEVQKFLTEGAELFKLGERYEVEIVQRGHNALYELLASIYDFSMRIENSSFKEKILTEIRKDLKDNHSITLKSNTPAINTMVKYMVRSDKVTASRYLKVLTVAQKENLPAADLPAYIARRGGVSQIQDVESAALAKATGDKNNKERTALIREYYELVGKASKLDFDFDATPRKFIDVETNESIQLFTENSREAYQKIMQTYFKTIATTCLQYQIKYVPVAIGDGFEKIMTSYLVEKQKFA